MTELTLFLNKERKKTTFFPTDNEVLLTHELHACMYTSNLIM